MDGNGVFVINYYVVSAWDIWDYGGFSGRAMVQSYPIIIFPIGYLLNELKSYKVAAYFSIPVIFSFLYVNIWWTYQAHAGKAIDPLCTTKEYFWKMLGRWHIEERYIKLKDTDELPETEPEGLQTIYEGSKADLFCVDGTVQIKRVLKLAFPKSLYKIKSTRQKWLRFSGDFQLQQKEWDVWKMPRFIVAFTCDTVVIKTRMIRTDRFMNDNESKTLFLDVKLPDRIPDSVSVSYWNGDGAKTHCVKHVCVSYFTN